jgi:hypothetical protein
MDDFHPLVMNAQVNANASDMLLCVTGTSEQLCAEHGYNYQLNFHVFVFCVRASKWPNVQNSATPGL